MVRERQSYWFERAGVEMPEIRIDTSDDIKTKLEVHLVREKRGLVYLYNKDTFFRTKYQHKNMSPAYLYWFSKTDPSVERISCDISDGQLPGYAQFTFSTCFTGKVLLTDQEFFGYRGYEETDRVARDAPAWDDRDETIFWRGQNNAFGVFSLEPHHQDQPWVMQRVRFATKAKGIPGVDVRFVPGTTHCQEAQCEAAGLMGPRRPWQAWAADKYAFDVDGYTNAWSNLMQRLKLGCCVLKVDSQHGYRQWYYDKLVPFETFVPVKADLSDLAEQVDWVRSHPDEAREIAANGQAFARAMTFETETRFATRTIENNWA